MAQPDLDKLAADFTARLVSALKAETLANIKGNIMGDGGLNAPPLTADHLYSKALPLFDAFIDKVSPLVHQEMRAQVLRSVITTPVIVGENDRYTLYLTDGREFTRTRRRELVRVAAEMGVTVT